MNAPQVIEPAVTAELRRNCDMLTALRLSRDISPSAYHSDPCPAPSFSASLGKVLLDKSPAHAYLRHPRLGGAGKEQETSDAMDFGSLVHGLILGKGADVLTIDADDWRSKEARTLRDMARASGKLPVLRKDMERAILVEPAFRAQLPAEEAALFNCGTSEQVIVADFANLKGDGRVYARGMVDRLHINRDNMTARIWDIKTCDDASPDKLERRVYEMHYEMQMACYEWLLESVMPELKGRVTSRLLFVETSEPYSVVAVELDGMFRQIGRSKLGRAWDTWCECIARGVWPSYTDKVLTLGPSPWAASREMDEISASA